MSGGRESFAVPGGFLGSDGPLTINHAGGNAALGMEDGFADLGGLSGEGNGDEVGEGAGRKLANLSFHAEGAGAVDGGHLQDDVRRDGRVGAGELSHFLEEVEFDRLFAGLMDAGEAVGAETQIDAGQADVLEPATAMLGISVAARAVDDVGPVVCEQGNVVRSE